MSRAQKEKENTETLHLEAAHLAGIHCTKEWCKYDSSENKKKSHC